jgi:hypothetical protein
LQSGIVLRKLWPSLEVAVTWPLPVGAMVLVIILNGPFFGLGPTPQTRRDDELDQVCP